MEPTFEREVLDRLIAIEQKLDSYQKAKEVTYENQRELIALQSDVKDLNEDVANLKDSNKWLFRTVAAAIITALIGIVFTLAKTGAGI
jgi:hypothetical protein